MNISQRSKINDRIIGGALSLTVATLIVKLLGVIYKIPLAAFLGDEGMGYFNTAYTVYSFFYLLCTAGVPKAVMILISERVKEIGEKECGKVVKIGITAFFILGFIIALIFAVFSGAISDMVGSNESRATMICIAPSIIFVSVAGVLRGYLTSSMQLSRVAVSQIIEGVIKLLFGLLFAYIAIMMELSVPMVSAFTVLGVTLGAFFGLVYLVVVSKNDISVEKARQKINNGEFIDVITKIAKISLPITVSAALMSLSGVIDLVLVMRRLEQIGYTVKEATSLFGNYTTLAVPMFNLIIALITPISLAFIPRLTEARVSEDREGFIDTLKSAMDLTSILTAPLVVGVCVYAKEILTILFGKSSDVGAPLLVLLAPGAIFMTYVLLFNSSLEALGKPGLALVSMIIASCVKSIVSGILLGNSNFGISGAPIGSVISYFVAFLVSLYILAHILEYNIPVLLSGFLPYLTSLIAFLSSKSLIFALADKLPLVLTVGICGICGVLIYIALAFFCGFLSREKFAKLAFFTNLH